ncbi:MAG: hypothetical protein ACI8WY_004209, partial [Planctomycetota bacterium]
GEEHRCSLTAAIGSATWQPVVNKRRLPEVDHDLAATLRMP